MTNSRFLTAIGIALALSMPTASQAAGGPSKPRAAPTQSGKQAAKPVPKTTASASKSAGPSRGKYTLAVTPRQSKQNADAKASMQQRKEKRKAGSWPAATGGVRIASNPAAGPSGSGFSSQAASTKPSTASSGGALRPITTKKKVGNGMNVSFKTNPSSGNRNAAGQYPPTNP